MANSNAPFGLRPVRTLSGAPFNEQTRKVYIPSTDTSAYFIGDAVVSAGSADTDGIPSVSKYTGTGTLRGVIVGFQTNIDTQFVVSVPATKASGYYAYIVEDPNTIFQVQGDSTIFAAANIGENADLTIAAPTGIANQSATVLDGASLGTTSTLAVRVLGLAQIPGNAFGAYAVLEVKINNSEYATGVAGV